MILACMALVSCVDTIILPDDKTVDEDFWQSKEDVALMVNSAYASMASEALLTRLVIWGDFRSDVRCIADRRRTRRRSAGNCQHCEQSG